MNAMLIHYYLSGTEEPNIFKNPVFPRGSLIIAPKLKNNKAP